MTIPRGEPAGRPSRLPERPSRRTGLVLVLAVAVAGIALAITIAGQTLLAPMAPTLAMDPPRFAEEAAAAGVAHRYDGEYPFFVGGGVAAFDCDDDGRPDLFLAGGAEPAALFRNASPDGGALRFAPVADAATDLVGVTGAYPLDIDADGRVDLAVLRLGENVILRGLGDCRFERANEALGIDGGDGLTTAFSATWESPTAALPTLAFGDYVTLDADRQASGTCAVGALVRPAADGAGYAPPIPLRPGWCTLSMLFSDWDRSGRRDLRVTNDRHYYRDGEEQLWRVAPGEPPRLYTRAEGWARLQIWGMGIASRDLTGDGYPEVFLTSQGDNKLQTLAGGPARPAYSDVAIRRGMTAHRPFAGGDILPSTAWHPAFEDVNNDGFVDLFISKGNVEGETDHAMKDPSNLLMGQPDGSFVEGAEAAGLLDYASSRGAALVDLNRDGLLDIVKVVRRQDVRLYRNVGSGTADAPQPMGRWIGVDLAQEGADRDAIGAWIGVRVGEWTAEREVTVGGGHVSGTLGPIHVGIGPADRADVRVTWPDGEVGPWMSVEADQVVQIERGATAAQPWTPLGGAPR